MEASRLKELLHYDRNTGEFTWKVSKGRARKGDRAGLQVRVGSTWLYWQLCIDGRKLYGQIAAIVITTGSWPKGPVTFRDGNTLNLARRNLKVSSHAEIQHKYRRQANNKTGYPGVSGTANGRYEAKFRRGETRVYVGRFDTPEEASRRLLLAQAAWDKLHRLQPATRNPG